MNKTYSIKFSSLKQGLHHFDFKIDDTFVREHNLSEIRAAKVLVSVLLEKTSRFLKLEFDLSGTVGLECDRCLELYDQQIAIQKELVANFDAENQSDSEDIITLSSADHSFNIEHYLYEFLVLALPMKRVHQDIKLCGEENIKFIHNFARPAEDDPRWDVLKNIK